MKKMTPIQNKKIHTFVRAGIQLLFFLFFPSAFVAGWNGVKYIFTQLGRQESVEMNSFVVVLCTLLAYTIVFGRFFCGYACAFGTFGDAVRAAYVWTCKKSKKKPRTWKESWSRICLCLKYFVMAGIVMLCFLGRYSALRGSSPWDVFSMVTAGNFKLGAYGMGVALMVVILIGMAFCERFFCRFLCPMGAVFTLMPVISLFSLKRTREECVKGCSGCKRVCPSNLDLPENEMTDVPGECIQCGKCVHACPRQNVKRMAVPKKLELVFVFVRAALLAAVLAWAGV